MSCDVIREGLHHVRLPCIRSIQLVSDSLYSMRQRTLPGKGGKIFLLAETWKEALDVGLSCDRGCCGRVIGRESHLAGVTAGFELSHWPRANRRALILLIEAIVVSWRKGEEIAVKDDVFLTK